MENKYDDISNIPSKYRWDLDSIYASMDAYYEDMEECRRVVEELKKFKGKVLSNASNLQNVLDLELKLDLLLDKMSNYISLNNSLDTRVGLYDSKLNELMDFYSKLELETNFISEELKKLDIDLLNRYLKENENLHIYEFNLKKVIRVNEHILSLEAENILSALSPVLNAGEDIFSKLDDADSDYGEVEDKDGRRHKLTGGTFSTYISSSDRILRKNADEAMHEYYKKHANTFASCLLTHVKTNVIESHLRNYNSALERFLSSDNIDVSFYHNFIKEVNANLKTLHRMMKIYKEKFALDEMHTYDMRIKYADGVKQNYTIEEMQDILLKALSPLGQEYMDGVREAFSNNWVDYYETKGKRSGAFSTTTVTTKPYLLLNYTGSFDDLETLAHELGHSMHTFFANKYCDKVNASYPIFLAEIASTTNELLLNNYLLNHTDDVNLKKYVLNNLISMYKSTIFRQTEFAEFESIIYEKIENGDNMSTDDFTKIYYDLQKKYYGSGVIQDDYIKYECFRIPHFYYNFYVYKYATSLAISYRFAYGILNNEEGMLENYLKFLKSGGRAYSLEILKSCGIDVQKGNILDYSIKMIEKYMDEFEKM